MIVNHCKIHNMGYKDIQKIENRFKIPQRLLGVRPGINSKLD